MIFSLGHSTHSVEKFLKLASPVSTIIDARSHPGSKKWPHFNRSEMENWLPDNGKNYEWWPGIGGWRSSHARLHDEMIQYGVDVGAYLGAFPKQRIAKGTKEPDENAVKQEFLPGIKPVWSNQGLYDYSWFMWLDEFIEDLKRLIDRGKHDNVAIICAEGPWYKCHRSMIADALVFFGSDCQHLPGKKLHSQMIGNRLERYDSMIVKKWKTKIAG